MFNIKFSCINYLSITFLFFIKNFSNQSKMTEDQCQFAHYSRQIISSIDGSLVTTSSIKLFVAPRDEIRPTMFRSAWYSKKFFGVGIFGIISISMLTAVNVASTDSQGNIIYIDF